MSKGNGMMLHAKSIFDEFGNEIRKEVRDDKDAKLFLRQLAKAYSHGAWVNSPARRVREIKLYKDLEILLAEGYTYNG